MSATVIAAESKVAATITGLLASYAQTHRDALDDDEEFARWLEEDYAPIAGGWHY